MSSLWHAQPVSTSRERCMGALAAFERLKRQLDPEEILQTNLSRRVFGSFRDGQIPS